MDNKMFIITEEGHPMRFWEFWARMERLLGRNISYNEIHELIKAIRKDEMLNENTKTEV